MHLGCSLVHWHSINAFSINSLKGSSEARPKTMSRQRCSERQRQLADAAPLSLWFLRILDRDTYRDRYSVNCMPKLEMLLNM